ncbi:hypothetical protein OG921_06700 [Aldersonia sp. NBC_00410]|uniref:hypothetical protein n=1 Tax=Aldersonia sp. NBC_00410 TaxID=2975954 RepID=UPI00225042E1|nr:hypothetical protein [Aldersonia sp. NBC_00410]MCX5042854.1 hypothetical protein [Aldersonia sp. NBC_00410]
MIDATADGTAQVVLRVLVYSSNAATRERVRLALGKRPHPDLAPFEYIEAATPPAVIALFDAGGLDLAILDGEASPAGGLGIAKQIKDEIDAPPPILVLIGRADDAWLANWSRAEATVAHPIDPFELTTAVVALLRSPIEAPETGR